MMRRHEVISRSFSLGFTVMSVLTAIWPVQAADLDETYLSSRVPANSPGVIAGVPGARVPDPRCRVVPQPEVNLYGDTTRLRPTLICMSRGIYADLYKPYPVRHPFYDWISSFYPFR